MNTVYSNQNEIYSILQVVLFMAKHCQKAKPFHGLMAAHIVHVQTVLLHVTAKDAHQVSIHVYHIVLPVIKLAQHNVIQLTETFAGKNNLQIRLTKHIIMTNIIYFFTSTCTCLISIALSPHDLNT